MLMCAAAVIRELVLFGVASAVVWSSPREFKLGRPERVLFPLLNDCGPANCTVSQWKELFVLCLGSSHVLQPLDLSVWSLSQALVPQIGRISVLSPAR
jgi:hypothetical protein